MLLYIQGEFLSAQCVFPSVTVPADVFDYRVCKNPFVCFRPAEKPTYSLASSRIVELWSLGHSGGGCEKCAVRHLKIETTTNSNINLIKNSGFQATRFLLNISS